MQLKDQSPGESIRKDAPPSEARVLHEVLAIWGELRELGHDHFRLAALETQRAGMSLAVMLAMGIMLAVLLNMAWFGLMIAAVAGLIENGVVISSAILLAVACSLLLALILIGLIRRQSRYLRYPAILRSLQPTSGIVRESDKSK